MAQYLPLDELSTVVGRIKGLLLTEEKVDRAVQLLARAIKEAVPGTVGAGVSLMDSRGRRTSAGFTDRVVEQADALQYELGQGPCLTAWAGEETVLVADARTDPRWPEWSAAVAVFTHPLGREYGTGIGEGMCRGAEGLRRRSGRLRQRHRPDGGAVRCPLPPQRPCSPTSRPARRRTASARTFNPPCTAET